MRNMLRCLVALTTCSVMLHLTAQVSTTYAFTQTTGTYTPITGGTVLAAGTFDDNVLNVDIPTFFFNGSYYSTMNVSTNGFLTFGSTAPAVNNYLPISNATAYSGAIVPFGGNLLNASSGTPEVRFQQVGNVAVVQWQDVKRSGAGTERFSFQARMDLGTGEIKFVYGAVTNLNAATTNQPQVGLRGPSNAQTNVKNRRWTSGAWLNSVSGTLNTHAMRFTSTATAVSPNDGDTYTFTPSCLSPTAVTSVSADCLTSTFSVQVTVTGLGTATAANIVASPGGALYSNVGLGTYTCGPFALGTPVTLTLVHTTNSGCTNVLGVFNPATNCATIANGDCLADPFLAIPDNGCSSGSDLQVIIPISGMNTTLGTSPGQTYLQSVEFIIAHTYRGDLQLRLTSPSGQTRDLLIQRPTPMASGSNFGNPGGCPGIVVQVRDDATTPLSAMDPDVVNVTGSYLPEQPLSGFTGNANGNWVFRVCDNGEEDAGTLRFVRVRLRNVDCNGTIGGTANPGTPCNDNNPNTSGDVWQPNCVCMGTGAAAATVSPRVFLEGPYDSSIGLMHDSLRTKGLVPLQEPYTGLGFPLTGGGGVSTTSNVLAITGNNAVVDWVVVELRSSSNSSTVLASKCALLQRDGDVVATDGLSPLTFSQVPGNYYVAIRHRNHLGAMTSTAVALGSSATTVDFTLPTTATYGTQAQNTVSGKNVLWRGNVFLDNKLAYTGTNNDRDPILVRIGSTLPTNVVSGYYSEDVDLDGYVKYTGPGNDRDPILVNVGSTIPTNTRNEQLP